MRKLRVAVREPRFANRAGYIMIPRRGNTMLFSVLVTQLSDSQPFSLSTSSCWLTRGPHPGEKVLALMERQAVAAKGIVSIKSHAVIMLEEVENDIYTARRPSEMEMHWLTKVMHCQMPYCLHKLREQTGLSTGTCMGLVTNKY